MPCPYCGFFFFWFIFCLFALDNQWGWRSHHPSRAPDTTDLSLTRKTNVKPMFLNYKENTFHTKNLRPTQRQREHGLGSHSPDTSCTRLLSALLTVNFTHWREASWVLKILPVSENKSPAQRKSKHSTGNRQPPNVYLHPILWVLL